MTSMFKIRKVLWVSRVYLLACTCCLFAHAVEGGRQGCWLANCEPSGCVKRVGGAGEGGCKGLRLQGGGGGIDGRYIHGGEDR